MAAEINNTICNQWSRVTIGGSFVSSSIATEINASNKALEKKDDENMIYNKVETEDSVEESTDIENANQTYGVESTVIENVYHLYLKFLGCLSILPFWYFDLSIVGLTFVNQLMVPGLHRVTR